MKIKFIRNKQKNLNKIIIISNNNNNSKNNNINNINI